MYRPIIHTCIYLGAIKCKRGVPLTSHEYVGLKFERILIICMSCAIHIYENGGIASTHIDNTYTW